jgi:trans-aconitate 2-methyltransferase
LPVSDWQPEQYLAFAGERSRPARDLLAQVPLSSAKVIYDLGCGPGNSTQLLADAYPGAEIVGIDNSPAMLVEARAACPAATFIDGDLAFWGPGANTDLLFSNAAFHWVPDHVDVLERLLRRLRPGSVLAVQMPDNLDEPSHRLMAETAGQGPWAAKLANAGVARSTIPAPDVYYGRLKPVCRHLDIWHTVYNHPLMGTAGIVAFVQSTGLRPWLAPLDPGEREAYLKDYEQRLAKAYPVQFDGTVLLRFPRLFLVAVV